MPTKKVSDNYLDHVNDHADIGHSFVDDEEFVYVNTGGAGSYVAGHPYSGHTYFAKDGPTPGAELEFREVPGGLALNLGNVHVNADYCSITHTWDIDTVANGSDTFTVTGHGLDTGERVRISTDGTLPSGVSAATDYYIIKVDADDFKLASSLANAQAGTAINITTDGTGTHTITLNPDGSIDPYPWIMLNYAIDAATEQGGEDGNVVIKNGTYSQGMSIVQPYSNRTVLIEAESQFGVIYTPGKTPQGYLSYDFILDGFDFPSTGGSSQSWWGRFPASGVRWIYRNCKFKGAGPSLGANNYSSAIRIQDSLINKTGTSPVIQSATNNGSNLVAELYNCTIFLDSTVSPTQNLIADCRYDIQGCIVRKKGSAMTALFNDTYGTRRTLNSVINNTNIAANAATNVKDGNPNFADEDNADFNIPPDSPAANLVPLQYVTPYIQA